SHGQRDSHPEERNRNRQHSIKPSMSPRDTSCSPKRNRQIRSPQIRPPHKMPRQPPIECDLQSGKQHPGDKIFHTPNPPLKREQPLQPVPSHAHLPSSS